MSSHAASFEEDKVKRSSAAIVPLWKWLNAQLRFSDVYIEVQPLEREAVQLEEELAQYRRQLSKLEADLGQLTRCSGGASVISVILIETAVPHPNRSRTWLKVGFFSYKNISRIFRSYKKYISRPRMKVASFSVIEIKSSIFLCYKIKAALDQKSPFSVIKINALSFSIIEIKVALE